MAMASYPDSLESMVAVHAPQAAPRQSAMLGSAAIDAFAVLFLAGIVLGLAPSRPWAWTLCTVALAVAVLVTWRGLLGGSVGHALLRLRSIDRLSGLPSFRFFAGRAHVMRGTAADPFALAPRHLSIMAPVHEDPLPESLFAHLRLLVDDGNIHIIHHAAIIGRNPLPSPDQRFSLIVVPDLTRTISKSHLAVEVGKDGVTVTDLRSANGTRVIGNDEPLAPRQPMLVQWGSTLLLGERQFFLERG